MQHWGCKLSLWLCWKGRGCESNYHHYLKIFSFNTFPKFCSENYVGNLVRCSGLPSNFGHFHFLATSLKSIIQTWSYWMFPPQLFNWPSLQVGKDTLFAIPGFQDVGFLSDPGKPRVQFIVLLGDKVYKKKTLIFQL